MIDLDAITPEELAARFRTAHPAGLPDGWERAAVVHAAHRLLARRCLERTPEFDESFTGRGVVICAGGRRLFTNAWVCLSMLRDAGCELPVQLWHLGECEMDQTMRSLVAPLGAECVDADLVAEDHPARVLNGWELKPYALLHCPFREVIMLDADNVPLCDPARLFDTPQYREHGAIFWPDYGRLDARRPIWEICEVPFRDEPEFETGQIVVDKRRCWRALHLTMHYNEHSDFYYHHVHGDKETFHMAFHRAGKSYAMPSRGIAPLDATMCQHDFEGRRIFQHRNLDKWRLDGGNRQVPGFQKERQCRQFLSQLRDRWHGRVHWNAVPTNEEQALIAQTAGRTYRYERVGHDQRELELRSDRTIGRGAAAMERTWTIKIAGDEPRLYLFTDDMPTCRLTLDDDGIWRGQWFRHERMPVVLAPLAARRRAADVKAFAETTS